jgi:large subunit ribosomal protein L44
LKFNWGTLFLLVDRLVKETGRLSTAPVFIVGIYSGLEKIGEGYGSSLSMAETRVSEYIA